MAAQWLLKAGLPLVNMLIMFGIGLTLISADFQKVMRDRKPVWVGLAGHYLFLPLLGGAFALLFRDTWEFAVGFVLIAACPSASRSNAITYLVRGNLALAVVLSAVSAVATLLSIPLLVTLALRWFGDGQQLVQLPLGKTVAHLFLLVLLPVLAGMAVRRRFALTAARIESSVNRYAFVLLLLLIATLAVSEWSRLQESLPLLGPAALAMCLVAIAGGYGIAKAFGLEHRNAITIGIEVGIQNSMLAILVGMSIMGSISIAMPAAVYGLLMYLPAIALVVLSRRHPMAGDDPRGPVARD